MVENSRGKMQTTTMTLEDLNDDIQTEILCRVPFRQLMQCKCVSKRWLSLISNPNPGFVARHSFLSMKKYRSWTRMYRTSINKKRVFVPAFNDPLFLSEGFSLEFLPFYQQPSESGQRPTAIALLALSNDLMLCCESNKELYEDVSYYLCNPSTMQWVALPPPQRKCYGAYVHLICESYEGMTLCKFKVVRLLVRIRSTDTLHMEIYSSETGQWMSRKLVFNPSKPFHPYITLTSWTCDETVCLAHNKQDSSSFDKFLMFNLTSVINNDASVSDASHSHHYYDVVDIPKPDQSSYSTLSVIAHQGRLRTVGLVTETVPLPILYIWQLKQNLSVTEDKWSLVLRVPLAEMVTFTNEEMFYYIVHRIWPGKKQVYRFAVCKEQPGDENTIFLGFFGYMASYNMWNKVLTIYDETNPQVESLAKKGYSYIAVLPPRPTVLPKLM